VILIFEMQVFRKDDRPVLGRKELFKNTMKKAVYAWKRIIELRLTGLSVFYSLFSLQLVSCCCLKWEVFVYFYRRGSCYAQNFCGPTCFYGSTLGTIQLIVLMSFLYLIYSYKDARMGFRIGYLAHEFFCRECLFLLSKDKEPRNSSKSGCLWLKGCK